MNLLEIEKDSKTYEKLLKKISISENGCWEVNGWKDKDGYTFVSIGSGPGRKKRTHRFTYELHKGKIPEGLTIDHLCKNEGCCNPDHLEAVTQAENNRRSETFKLENYIRSLPQSEMEALKRKRVENTRKTLAAKTHCRKGHPKTLENTYISPKGDRRCQICFNNCPSMVARKNKGK